MVFNKFSFSRIYTEVKFNFVGIDIVIKKFFEIVASKISSLKLILNFVQSYYFEY